MLAFTPTTITLPTISLSFCICHFSCLSACLHLSLIDVKQCLVFDFFSFVLNYFLKEISLLYCLSLLLPLLSFSSLQLPKLPCLLVCGLQLSFINVQQSLKVFFALLCPNPLAETHLARLCLIHSSFALKMEEMVIYSVHY